VVSYRRKPGQTYFVRVPEGYHLRQSRTNKNIAKIVKNMDEKTELAYLEAIIKKRVARSQGKATNWVWKI